MATKQSRLDLDWAADIELLASAMESGLLVVPAFLLLANRASSSWRQHFQSLAHLLDSGDTSRVTFAKFKTQAADPRFDFLLELVTVHSHFGGTAIVPTLLRCAREHRARASVRDDVAGRITSIVAVSRLGAAAPLFMLALLCSRAENLQAYLTGFGPLIVAFGAVVCALSLGIIGVLARLPEYSRGLAA